MTIIPLADLPEASRRVCAQLLVDGFRDHWPNAWPTLEEAIDEVHSFLHVAERTAFVVVEGEDVLGWIGGISTYDGNVWELHPMVVRQESRGRGIGRLLVEVLEKRARDAGAFTLWLGTDDEDDMTSLANADLYTDTFQKLNSIENLRGHPYTFYQKMGFKIMGVCPDANGPGKPDIFMAKRLR